MPFALIVDPRASPDCTLVRNVDLPLSGAHYTQHFACRVQLLDSLGPSLRGREFCLQNLKFVGSKLLGTDLLRGPPNLVRILHTTHTLHSSTKIEWITWREWYR